MDQLRDSLSEAVSSTSAQVSDAVNTVTDRVSSMAGDAAAANESAAQSVHVEVVDNAEKPAE